MRWIVFAITAIACTVGLAAWIGWPNPLTIQIPDFSREEDLNINRIEDSLRVFTATPSRMTGSPGAEQAAEYITGQLKKLGVQDIEIQEFEATAPEVQSASISGPGGAPVTLEPIWPNLVRTSQTPPEGLSGKLIDVGNGAEASLKGHEIRNAIVIMDWVSESEWLSVQEFGGKAVIFRGGRPASGVQARKKFLTVPANIPRFYAPPAALPALEALIGQTATVHCQMDWANKKSRNIFAQLTPGAPPTSTSAVDKAPVIFHAYYDSVSVTPALAPGAEQAIGAASLLELARFIKKLPETPPRPIYVLFTGGHAQAMTGMIHFTRRLYDGLDNGWPQVEHGGISARMGRPGIFVGLDISSRSDRMGIFCVGAFRGQAEGYLRPKFSMLAQKLDSFAKSYMTDYEKVTLFTATPFVDCINLTLGRGWWTYFPYRAPFESEIPTLAGFPGVTLSTINDERRAVDTPDDTLANVNLDLLQRQLHREPGRRAGLANIAMAFAYWKGPFTSSELESNMAKLGGRAVWLDQQRDYIPNNPMPGACVAMKTYQNNKHLNGMRGIPLVLAGPNGEFEFDGLANSTANPWFSKPVEVEAFGLATPRFLEANSRAANEYALLLQRGSPSITHIPPDGSIIYAVDQARPTEQPFLSSILEREQSVKPVLFPCKPITLFGLTEPRGFISLFDVQILDASNDSPPFQWGLSYSDSFQGDPEENCITLWAAPALRVKLAMGLGFQEKRLVLLNNTPENPEGEGYMLANLETIPSWVLQGAGNMWRLDEKRIQKFVAHGISNPRIQSLHDEAKANLELAENALGQYDYMAYRSAAERGWALESNAYNELLNTANNMIRGVLFYLLLMIPFAYCLERLIINAGAIRGRVIGIFSIFTLSFLLLAVIHPAFRFTLTPALVLIAFVILALAVSVSMLILGHFDRMLRDRKQALIGTHEDTVAAGDIAMRAVDLGIANIRRRPQRAFFTGMTVVLVTFTLLSFTSIVPETTISRLRHPNGEPVYKGLLARDRAWLPLPLPFYDSLRRTFDKEATSDAVEATLAGRVWYFSDLAGELSKIDIARPPSEGAVDVSKPETGQTTTEALIGMEPSEAAVSAVASTLIAGRWFESAEEQSIILPAHAAQQLGYGPQDIGRKVLLFGQELPLVGIIDGDQFDKLRDIDGEPLTPVNFAQQRLLEAQQEQEQEIDTLKDYIHWTSNQLAIVPFELARNLGGTIRSIAVRTGENTSADEQAAAYARRSNLTILASNGEDVTLYASLNRSKLTAAGQILIPIGLGFIMVLGAMLGSVYERRNEIFVYNSVGLSPSNVASLFLAESSVYAVLGAVAGYLLGNLVSKILLETQALSGLSLNYSAGTTILITVMTMGIVLVSTIYPARQAFLAAIPQQRREHDDIEDDENTSGSRISMFLPFVATPSSVMAMQAYMYEFLDSVQGVSVGQLAVDHLDTELRETNGKPEPVLKFLAWLAPFDLGLSHMAELSIVYRPERGVYQYHLLAVRHSGDQQNWRRLTPRFILAIRKQLLIWRILPPEDLARYNDKATSLFGAPTIM